MQLIIFYLHLVVLHACVEIFDVTKIFENFLDFSRNYY